MKQTFKNKIPNGWKEINLGSACVFERGMEPGAEVYNSDGIGERFLRVVDVTESRSNFIYVDVPTIKRLKKKDIALTLDGTIGAVKMGLEGIYSTGIRKVYFRDRNSNSNLLLYYLLKSNNIQKIIDLYASGSTIKHASSAIPHLNTIIPISYSEQEKIAEVLSLFDEVINETELLIQKQKQRKSGMLQDLLQKGIGENGLIRSNKEYKFKKTKLGFIPENWSIKPLTFAASFQNGKAFPSSEYSNEGILLLRPGNFQLNEFVQWDKDHLTYLPKVWEKKAKEYLVYENELVMNLTAQSLEEGFLGRVCMTPIGTRCLLNQRLARFKEKNCHLPFLFWALRGNNFRAQVDKMPQGIKVQHLYNSNLEEIMIALPDSLEEQKRIADALFLVSAEIEEEEKFKSKLVEIRSGLTEDLLSGNTLVQRLIKK